MKQHKEEWNDGCRDMKSHPVERRQDWGSHEVIQEDHAAGKNKENHGRRDRENHRGIFFPLPFQLPCGKITVKAEGLSVEELMDTIAEKVLAYENTH